MEVGQIHINVSPNRPAAAERPVSLNEAGNSGISASIRGNSFDYNQVMMDLEEVKSFLYMVVGGGSLKVSNGDKIGSNINTLA